MPYKDPTSDAAKASLKRRQERYNKTGKRKISMDRYNQVHGRDRYYRFQHGITEAAFEAQIQEQSGLCPIGNHPLGPRGKTKDSPCQDHNHETDANRAVICREHNVGLGCFHDSIAELESAISYLKKYQSV